MTIEWGAEIEVGGVRPEWLADDENMKWKKLGSAQWRGSCKAKDHNWSSYIHTPNTETTSICLPADHFAYKAIAKGFTPWGGGSEAPKDWDGGEVMLRAGHTFSPEGGDDKVWNWEPDGDPLYLASEDCIGYHPKPIAQPLPADTVTVVRMTEVEWDALLPGQRMDDWARKIGLIRPTTRAERIAATTGIALPDVEAVLNAIEETE